MHLNCFFHSMDPITFQDFCISILTEINGLDVIPGGRGPDGGRDALYNGPLFISSDCPKLIGNWLIQIKHHNINDYSRKEWGQLISKDLKIELRKLQKTRNLDFDSYLFITNIPLTWVPGKGTFDKIQCH